MKKTIAILCGDEAVMAEVEVPETMMVIGGNETGGFGKAKDVFATIERMSKICKGMTMMEAMAVMSTAPIFRQRLNETAQVTFNDAAIRRSFEPHAI